MPRKTFEAKEFVARGESRFLKGPDGKPLGALVIIKSFDVKDFIPKTVRLDFTPQYKEYTFNANCAQAHGLKETETESGNYECDICKKSLKFGVIVHSCAECEFDLCKQCYDRSAEGLPKLQAREIKAEDMDYALGLTNGKRIVDRNSLASQANDLLGSNGRNHNTWVIRENADKAYLVPACLRRAIGTDRKYRTIFKTKWEIGASYKQDYWKRFVEQYDKKPTRVLRLKPPCTDTVDGMWIIKEALERCKDEQLKHKIKEFSENLKVKEQWQLKPESPYISLDTLEHQLKVANFEVRSLKEHAKETAKLNFINYADSISDFDCIPILLSLKIDEHSKSGNLTHEVLTFETETFKKLIAEKKFYAMLLITTLEGGLSKIVEEKKKERKRLKRRNNRAAKSAKKQKLA